SRARNRSADPVVSCFFGRIAPSDAATESCFSIRGNRENEIASFQGLRHGNLAISSQQSRRKTTLAQWVRSSSRATTFNVSSTVRRATRSRWLLIRSLHPDVLLAYTTPVPAAFERESGTIPIVFVNVSDPIGSRREPSAAWR